ncbi:hypothetical protein PJ176_04705, partial [Escherichia coli]|nr:hypothetical protein [Escherichia coli]
GHINITVTAGVSRAFPEEPLDVVIGRAYRKSKSPLHIKAWTKNSEH